MRGISDAPTNSAISGLTGRGFIMPRGRRSCCCDDTVAQVTVRHMRTVAGEGEAGSRQEEEGEELSKVPALGEKKEVKIAEEKAI